MLNRVRYIVIYLHKNQAKGCLGVFNETSALGDFKMTPELERTIKAQKSKDDATYYVFFKYLVKYRKPRYGRNRYLLAILVY